jgi:protein-S-isoprenylcysteine O-methyltransferase Ste14
VWWVKNESIKYLTTRLFISTYRSDGNASLPLTKDENPCFPRNLLGIIPLLVGVSVNLLADRSFKRHEEKKCEEAFGKKWLEYKKKVRRWV